MRIVIIGGTGHTGSWLVPMLVNAGHELICITRGQRKPYKQDDAWDRVQMLTLDKKSLEQNREFGTAIARLRPDIVIDMICFTLETAQQLVNALRGSVKHFLHCGTIWVHGHSTEVPATEDQARNPFGEYGIQKAAIEKYLLTGFRENGFPVTILHPGHITGPGWAPINPAGNLNPAVFEKLRNGEELLLPNIGMETVHHIHASDLAQAFANAIEYPNQSIGENFHIVSEKAISLRGFAESVAGWFGREAKLGFLPWKEWTQTVSEADAERTWDHIAHSPNASIEKAKRLIHYKPQYSSLEAVREAVEEMGFKTQSGR
jgi:nucleoside-diphosphate-sugar epimerase